MMGTRVQTDLSVEERVQVELDAHRRDNPGQTLSVAEICRRAGVSRSNLYEFHSSLVTEIRGKPAVAKRAPSGAQKADSRDSVKQLKERNRALLILYAELLQEVRLLRARLDRVQRSKRK